MAETLHFKAYGADFTRTIRLIALGDTPIEPKISNAWNILGSLVSEEIFDQQKEEFVQIFKDILEGKKALKEKIPLNWWR